VTPGEITMEPSVEEIIHSYDANASLAEAFTIPAPWYTDLRIAELERRTVFSRTWQMVGRIEQVSSPGQYITAEVAGEPILVVRDEDGQLRAFFNVCRHHAAAVAPEPSGCVAQFRCPYHGWTYSTTGALKGTPEFDGVCNFDRSSNGLLPVRAETWDKFVFVNLDSNACALKNFLGGLVERVTPLELDSLHFVERRVYTLNCNWKVFVDNYLDGGYHVPHLHKGLNSVLDYVHYTVENVDRACIQSTPMRASGDAEAAAAATRQGDRAYYVWQYPNFMINWYQGVMDTNLVLPVAVDSTRVIFDFYFANPSEATHHRESIGVSEKIQDEDVAICESVQRGLRSRAYGAGRLSVRREAGEHLFHQLLFRDLKDGLA
jgi:choline monooxygenase